MRESTLRAVRTEEDRKKADQVLAQFEEILKKASKKTASDIHLKTGLPPIVRVNGQLYYLGQSAADKALSERLTSTYLIDVAYALMNPRMQQRYESGAEIDLGYEVPGAGRFRVSICQQRSTPRIVCRHIPDRIPLLHDLGLPESVNSLTTAQRGLILVTGATGSGKSTTIASMLDDITRNQSCHVLTIEDPIEFVFQDRKSIVTQREVGADTPNFVQALRHGLRQDPDVIFIGEMRDEETMMLALNAAETGHLVFSTLHTINTTETINRIIGGVAEGFQSTVRAQLGGVLVGIVSQRLLRRASGKGRIPAVEILLANQRVKDKIIDPLRTVELSNVLEDSVSLGMQSFDQSLMDLLKKNLISKEEALLNCTNVRDFQLRLEGIVSGDWRENEKVKEEDRAQQVQAALKRDESGNIEIELEEDSSKKKNRPFKKAS